MLYEVITRILCNGFGCSHQIKVMTGREPLHLVSLLAAALPGKLAGEA